FDLALKLWKEIRTDMIIETRLIKRQEKSLTGLLNHFIDEKRIRDSKIGFGLVTVELPNITPRYFFTDDIPKGKMVDYIAASASLFPAIRVADIDNIKYVDGGYLDNLPVGMAIEKKATHVIAVDLETAGIVQQEPLKQAENLVLIRCKWGLGDIMVFDSKSSSKNIRLGYLDTLKAFGFLDGYYYSFSKGEMSKKNIHGAEMAAKIFDLDPQFLYSKNSFNNSLLTSVQSYKQETKSEVLNFHDNLKNLRPDKELLLSLLKKVNQKTLTLIIAEHLKASPEIAGSILLKPAALLFKDESKAANYLIRENLF
ncbi:MAG TPA: patatin-like phospholipase family protein, partial [Anaerovoracaceae bacterium]|nr:patatin-like phospholipase family protein [Anaerovoracaceae bacterium]